MAKIQPRQNNKSLVASPTALPDTPEEGPHEKFKIHAQHQEQGKANPPPPTTSCFAVRSSVRSQKRRIFGPV